MEAEKGLQMKETLQPKKAEMEEALHPMQPEQGQEKEVALHGLEDKKGLQVEETLALHRIEAEQETPHLIESEMGLQMEETPSIHGIEAEQTLHPMEAEGGVQVEETLALHRIESEQERQMEETLHWMESEMGLKMEETLIRLLEAVVAEERAGTSRMRDERVEMEAAVEAKGNELEFLKTNRDRCVAEQLLLQDAEQLLRDILFPPN